MAEPTEVLAEVDRAAILAAAAARKVRRIVVCHPDDQAYITEQVEALLAIYPPNVTVEVTASTAVVRHQMVIINPSEVAHLVAAGGAPEARHG